MINYANEWLFVWTSCNSNLCTSATSCLISPGLSLSLTHTHTCLHLHLYLYLCCVVLAEPHISQLMEDLELISREKEALSREKQLAEQKYSQAASAARQQKVIGVPLIPQHAGRLTCDLFIFFLSCFSLLLQLASCAPLRRTTSMRAVWASTKN
jgi:hypothetical protein